MVRGLVVAVLCGCAAPVVVPPPPPPLRPEPIDSALGSAAPQTRSVFEPRPSIPVPPLGLPPGIDDIWPAASTVLEPHLPLAELFGIAETWPALCEQRPRPRTSDADELIDYALAWCRVGHDPGALDALAHLTHARSWRVAQAVRADLPVVVASTLHADAIAGSAVAGLVDLDVVAATYHALGADGDARALVASPLANDPTRWTIAHDNECRHLVMFADLAPLAERRAALAIAQRVDTSARCRAVQAILDCPLASSLAPGSSPVPCTGRCADIARIAAKSCRGFIGPELSEAGLALVAAYTFWPGPDDLDWLGFARVAATAIRAVGDEQLMRVALDNAVIRAPCNPAALDELHTTAVRLGPAAADFAQLTYEECRERHRRAGVQ